MKMLSQLLIRHSKNKLYSSKFGSFKNNQTKNESHVSISKSNDNQRLSLFESI
jgi:hypothetical protein